MASTAEVTQLYKDLLGRTPDSEGLKTYTGMDTAAATASIRGSKEYREREIKNMYQSLLGRGADPAGLRSYVESDLDLGGISRSIKGSEEFATKDQRAVDSLMGNLAKEYSTMQNPADIYNEALAKLGISDARTNVTNLRQNLLNTQNLLSNIESDVSARTQDFNVSENQRRRVLAAEQQPLAGQVQGYDRALQTALGDYGMVLDEGKTQAELKFEGDREKRSVLMDQIQFAIDKAKNTEDKRRWEAELSRLKTKDAEAIRQFNETLALDKAKYQASLSKASSGGKSGGGGGSSGGGSNGMSQSDAKQEFLDFVGGKFDEAGGAGAHKATRQQQDAWANAWFASKGVTDPEDRQFYWDAFNSAYNRPENPYDDWLYKR